MAEENSWRDWPGGEMPVSGDTLVDVRWGDGAIYERQLARTWGWNIPVQPGVNDQDAGIIVAWRPAEAERAHV
ncbi:hypothetical protein [Rhizobium leguminosarum]